MESINEYLLPSVLLSLLSLFLTTLVLRWTTSTCTTRLRETWAENNCQNRWKRLGPVFCLLRAEDRPAWIVYFPPQQWLTVATTATFSIQSRIRSVKSKASLTSQSTYTMWQVRQGLLRMLCHISNKPSNTSIIREKIVQNGASIPSTVFTPRRR